MYYYQPIDIENKEIWEVSRESWHESDIKAAYLEAFDEAL